MKTTNFAIARTLTHNNIVSIALKSASEFHGREYKKLAPPWWILNAYRENRDKKQYIRNYQKYVLDHLDAEQVYRELGDNAILCCYERKGEFCHRRLVAAWFQKELKIDVPELWNKKIWIMQ